MERTWSKNVVVGEPSWLSKVRWVQRSNGTLTNAEPVTLSPQARGWHSSPHSMDVSLSAAWQRVFELAGWLERPRITQSFAPRPFAGTDV